MGDESTETRIAVVETRVKTLESDVAEPQKLKGEIVRLIGGALFFFEFGSKIVTNLTGEELVKIVEIFLK